MNKPDPLSMSREALEEEITEGRALLQFPAIAGVGSWPLARVLAHVNMIRAALFERATAEGESVQSTLVDVLVDTLTPTLNKVETAADRRVRVAVEVAMTALDNSRATDAESGVTEMVRAVLASDDEQRAEKERAGNIAIAPLQGHVKLQGPPATIAADDDPRIPDVRGANTRAL